LMDAPETFEIDVAAVEQIKASGFELDRIEPVDIVDFSIGDVHQNRQGPTQIELGVDLGQGSAFEGEHGFYLDPIAPEVLTLPDNWRQRLVQVPLSNGIVVFFLDPNDAAVSKYARGEPRDREWIRAGLAAGVLNAGVIASRFRETAFLDDDERRRAEVALTEDRALP